MSWLHAGVPLTLLIDLLDPRGPDSTGIFEAERRSHRAAWWVSSLVAHVSGQMALPAGDLAPSE